jgi:glyoxylate reductase
VKRPELVVATAVAPVVFDRLREHADVVDVSALPRERWDASLATAAGLLVGSAVAVDAALLAAAPALRIVATYSVGYDNIALAELARRGIALANTRGSLNAAVADLTFGLVLIALRRLGQGIDWVRSGRWMLEAAPYGHDLAGATLGIIGFGAIGLDVARRAQVSGMRVLYHNRPPGRRTAPSTTCSRRPTHWSCSSRSGRRHVGCSTTRPSRR